MSIELFILMMVLLLLPYEWQETRSNNGCSGYLRSALYLYHYRPDGVSLSLDGLRRLQLWLLVLITTIASHLQTDLIAWLLAGWRALFGL